MPTLGRFSYLFPAPVQRGGCSSGPLSRYSRHAMTAPITLCVSPQLGLHLARIFSLAGRTKSAAQATKQHETLLGSTSWENGPMPLRLSQESPMDKRTTGTIVVATVWAVAILYFALRSFL